MKPDCAVTAHHIAGLATLESTVEIAARALLATYPDIRHIAPRHDEPAAVTTARALVDACERLLAALDNYRSRVVAHLPKNPDHPIQLDWPF
jgi:hypothetical protein